MLKDVLDTLTTLQKQHIANQLAGFIKEWRQFTSPRIQTVNGAQLGDLLIGWCEMYPATCKMMGYNESQWLAQLIPDFREGLARLCKSEDEVHKLIDSFPKSTTYYFTHGDLNPSNIFVDEEANVTAIIDFESSGFYPSWAERAFIYRIQDSRMQKLMDMVEHDL